MIKRTLGPAEMILRLEKGGASADGLQVMFDIVTKDGKSHSFLMAGADIEKTVNYIIGLSQHAASESGHLKPPEGPEQRTVHPIEAAALSVAPGRTNSEVMLGVHLGTFALTFAVPANQAKQLQERLGQILVPIQHPGLH